MRGKLILVMLQNFNLRITPACAGKTLKRSAVLKLLQDHPRVCGENVALEWVNDLSTGSPPRVRGKQAKQD